MTYKSSSDNVKIRGLSIQTEQVQKKLPASNDKKPVLHQNDSATSAELFRLPCQPHWTKIKGTHIQLL